MPTPRLRRQRRRGPCEPCRALPMPQRSSTTRWPSAHTPPRARSAPPPPSPPHRTQRCLHRLHLAPAPIASEPAVRRGAILQPSRHHLAAISLPSPHYLPTVSQATEAAKKAALRPRTAAAEALRPAPLELEHEEHEEHEEASWGGCTSAASQPGCTPADTSAAVWRPLSLKLRGSLWMGRCLGAQSQPNLGAGPEPPRGLTRQATAPNVGRVGARPRPRPAQCDVPQSAPFVMSCRSADSRRYASP
jgi:hypothetical protein